MSVNERNAKILTWSATDTTVGACGIVNIIALGSATASTLTLLDGTAIKIVAPVATTAMVNIAFERPAAFANLITDMTGNASYTVAFITRP